MNIKELTWQNASYCFLRHHESRARFSWPNLTWMSGGQSSCNYKLHFTNKSIKYIQIHTNTPSVSTTVTKLLRSNVFFHMYKILLSYNIKGLKWETYLFRNIWKFVQWKLYFLSYCIHSYNSFRREPGIAPNAIYTQLLLRSPHLNSGLLHVTTAI